MRKFYIAICPLAIFLFLFFGGCRKETISDDLNASFQYEASEIATGIKLGSIYSTKNFAAFTDLVHYNNEWYVTFRVGTKHIGGINGQIKILKSKDKINWAVDYIIKNDSLDLRDPKFTLDTPNNKLYISFFGTFKEPTDPAYHLYNFMSDYSSVVSGIFPDEISDNSGEKFAFWRYTYNKNKVYCAAFHVPVLGGYVTDNICLFINKNNFRDYVSIGKLNLGKSPNEATIRFDEHDNMYYLIRRETANVVLGISSPSDYSVVKWIEDPLKIRLSSPNFLFYKDKLLITGRDQDELTFKLLVYNLNSNKVEKTMTFPSGVETGYGGMSFDPLNSDMLLISYYVITSSKSYINLAEVDLNIFIQ